MEIYLPIAELPVNVLLVMAIGAAVGFVSGMFGVGGGFLMTPFLIFIGVPPAVAVATGAAQIAASSTTGALNYFRKRALDLRLGLVLVVAGLVGTLLGVLFFNAMKRLGQLDLVISLSYTLLLGWIGVMMLVESVRSMMREGRGGAGGALGVKGPKPWFLGLPLRIRFHRSGMYASVLPFAAVALLISFAGAVLGIGGGFLLVPALIYLFRVPTAVVVGTSLFQILFTMIAATLLHAVTNQSVDLILALILIIGGVIGAPLGARAGRNLKAETFRLMLALLILAVAMRFGLELLIPPDDPYTISIQGIQP
jgi:uncharacterized membrane protein YfcA